MGIVDIRTGKPIAAPTFTRRKVLGGLAGILATGAAPAAFVRSAIGARTAAWSGGLPYDEELVYLQSAGNHYIDTGVSPLAGDNFSTTFRHNQLGGTYQNLFGIRRINTNAGYFAISFRSWGSWAFNGIFGSTTTSNFSNAFNAKRTITKEGASLKLLDENGDLLQEMTITDTWSPDQTITAGLFVFHVIGDYSDSYSYPSYCMVYSHTHTRNGVKLVDMIPVLKDGVPCMYDKVGGGFFYNLVSGHTFGYGKNDGTVVAPT